MSTFDYFKKFMSRLCIGVKLTPSLQNVINIDCLLAHNLTVVGKITLLNPWSSWISNPCYKLTKWTHKQLPHNINSKFLGPLKKSMQTWRPIQEEPAYCCATVLNWHFKLDAFTSEKEANKVSKKSLNLWRRPAPLNWLKTIEMEPRVHLGKEVAFRLQETAIADSLFPVIWENCLFGRTNTGRNQQHTSVLEDRWGTFPCTFQTIASKEVFSTGSFFSSSRAGV